MYIASENEIFAPSYCYSIFSFYKYENSKYISNLISISFNNNFNTSNVTDNGMGGMFQRCSSLTSLDLSSFNTAKVTDISYMFYSCSKLQTEITITGTNITNYANMFSNALTDTNDYVIINYSSEAESIAQGMKLTAPTSNQSKITLKQI